MSTQLPISSLVPSLARSVAQLRQARQATVSPSSSKYNPRVILFSGFAFFAKTCVWVRISQKISGKKVKSPKFRSSFRIPAGSRTQIFLQHPKPGTQKPETVGLIAKWPTESIVGRSSRTSHYPVSGCSNCSNHTMLEHQK